MLAGLGFIVQAIFNCSLSDMSRARLETLIKVISKALASAQGSEKEKKKKPDHPKSEGACQCLLPIYVFHDS